MAYPALSLKVPSKPMRWQDKVQKNSPSFQIRLQDMIIIIYWVLLKILMWSTHTLNYIDLETKKKEKNARACVVLS